MVGKNPLKDVYKLPVLLEEITENCCLSKSQRKITCHRVYNELVFLHTREVAKLIWKVIEYLEEKRVI